MALNIEHFKFQALFVCLQRNSNAVEELNYHWLRTSKQGSWINWSC